MIKIVQQDEVNGELAVPNIDSEYEGAMLAEISEWRFPQSHECNTLVK